MGTVSLGVRCTSVNRVTHGTDSQASLALGSQRQRSGAKGEEEGGNDVLGEHDGGFERKVVGEEVRRLKSKREKEREKS